MFFLLSLFGNVNLDKKFLLIIGAVILGGVSSIYVFLTSQENVQTENYAEQIMVRCNGKVHCAIEALMDMDKTEKQSTVLATFKGLVSKYQQSTYSCHDPAHHLGMFLYAYIGNLTQALSYADQKCGGAVYHGLVESFMKQRFSHVNRAEIDVTSICPKNTENPYSSERWECLHAIGHGLTSIYDYDVLGAVQRCDKFELGWEEVSCSKGVFMENSEHVHESGIGTFDKDDLFFPCDAVDAKYAPACYHYHTLLILKQNNYSTTESFKTCDKIIPEEFVKYCYGGLGRQLVRVSMESPRVLCQIGQPLYQNDCLKGAVAAIADNMGIDDAFEFCKRLTEQFKVGCYDVVGKWVHMLHSTAEERAKDCSKAERSDYFEICMNASLEVFALL